MITAGIDLAAQPEDTAACVIDWADDGTAVVTQVVEKVTDDCFNALVANADKVGIDAPFGWPDAFVAAVTAHRDGKGWPLVETRELRLRRTDVYAWKQTGRAPLSVSADKIAAVAFRAARLLSGRDVDRTGSSKFVEVYPRATRDRLGIDSDWAMFTLRRLMPWLHVNDYDADLCDRSEHCLDALIAALAARASSIGLCDPVPPLLADAARREGWIALPWPGSLDLLAGHTPATTFASWGRWSHEGVARVTREWVADGTIEPPVTIVTDEGERQEYADNLVPGYVVTAGQEKHRIALAFYDNEITVGVWYTAWDGHRPYSAMEAVGSVAIDSLDGLTGTRGIELQTLVKAASKQRSARYRKCSDCGRSVASEHRLRLDGREFCHGCAERGQGVVF